MPKVKCRVCGQTVVNNRCSNPGCPSHIHPEPDVGPDPQRFSPSDTLPPSLPIDTLQRALEGGAILIRRAANGWILETASYGGQDAKWVEVFEDPSDCPFCGSVSLAQLLLVAFEDWMQTEEHGGLNIILAEEPDHGESG